MPLNIDLQQILLHWMNLAILAGGLYFLLYKPVKQFMAKREEHYRELDQQAQDKLAQADRIQAEYRDKLEGAEEEIRQSRAKAQQSLQQSVQEQLDQAQAQAELIVSRAQADAERTREQALYDSQQDIRRLAETAAKRLALHEDPFDQFLNLAEGGGAHESE